jgi:signal transduction histidine kinase/integral membrane sensor domain MASE1
MAYLPRLALPLLVCVAYYLGAWGGSLLRIPPATSAVMWPPNAILTAALLLLPPRRWWIALAAAFPAHVAMMLQVHASPLAFIPAIFLTNCSEALIAAIGVHWLSDRPTRYDTLRRVLVFILAAGVAAPYFSSFADAAVVSMFKGEPYWAVWRTRFFSNVLTELALVPCIVILVTTVREARWRRTFTSSRSVEAMLLAAGLLAAAVFVFVGPLTGPRGFPGSPATPPVAFVLPFLIWAAVRFGVAGVSFSLLATTLVAIAAGMDSRGSFAALSPAEAVRTIQLSVSVVAIPLLCLAGVVEERRAANELVKERLRFEELLSRLSSAFVHLSAREMAEAFEHWLARVGEHVGVDRAMLFEFSRDAREITVVQSWSHPAVSAEQLAQLTHGRADAVPQLLAEESIAFPPPRGTAAYGEGDPWYGPSVRSSLTLPLVTSSRVVGGLALISVTARRRWSEDVVQHLQLIATVFANALARRGTESALRESEAMKSAILDSLSSHVVVLDRDGDVIAVNESWSRFVDGSGAPWGAASGPSGNYLELCRRAAMRGAIAASEALAGIEPVMRGSRNGFSLEYATDDDRWFAMLVVPLDRPQGGVVISHTDVTERKRVEMAAQRSRQELAHFSRVSMMGALTASLAHELNQPLAGILANAQAGRRLLQRSTPDLEELHAIMSDIIEDDKRAGEVIRRLRELLRKGEPQMLALDLHGLLDDVVKLVHSDAVIRNVRIKLDVSGSSAIVRGDRIQLQQVLLNLLVNAMEAMIECHHGDRTITIRTECDPQGTVRVLVEDTGPGLSVARQEQLFEAFYTTKASGMGVGLSICRAIVEAHGGMIGAASNAGRGATFYFVLPRVSEMVA